MPVATIDEVCDFWFAPTPDSLENLMTMVSRQTPGLDAEVREKFSPSIAAARRGELDAWADTPRGLLALLILLDQMPRHAFRGSVEQYASDAKALQLALGAFDKGWHHSMSFAERVLLGMPLVHSENVEMQRRSVAIGDELAAAAPDWVDFFAEIPPAQARKYLGVVERFGRFPHRNEMYGRTSTPEELEFLETWGEVQPPDVLRERGLIPAFSTKR